LPVDDVQPMRDRFQLPFVTNTSRLEDTQLTANRSHGAFRRKRVLGGNDPLLILQPPEAHLARFGLEAGIRSSRLQVVELVPDRGQLGFEVSLALDSRMVPARDGPTPFMGDRRDSPQTLGGRLEKSGSSGVPLHLTAQSRGTGRQIGDLLPNTVVIGGKNFSVWYGQNGTKPVVSYVAQQNFTSWTFSLGDFIQDAVTRDCQGTTKCVNPSWYLTTVFAGFEIWRGSVGLEIKDFGVTVP